MQRKLLKQDTFGSVWATVSSDGPVIERKLGDAPRWARWLARWLARSEAQALLCAEGIEGIPALVDFSGQTLLREWLDGEPMQRAQPRDAAYYREALRLLRRLHRRGIVHNDLAKEPNWLVRPDGRPALIDFQLARIFPRRGRWFRLLAREDLRHLLKHKRTYCEDSLSARQRRMLATPAWPSRLWMATGKRVYLFVTRKLLGWADREGAADRHGL